MLNKTNSRVEDVDFYIVGAAICSAIGGTSQGIALMILACICWFGNGFRKGIEDGK